jgi:hypothetical protein
MSKAGGPAAAHGVGQAGIGRAGEPSNTARKMRAQEQALADLRFARNVDALWKLGPRPLYELLAEFGRERLLRACIEVKVRRYVDRLSPELLASIGADRFPLAPPRHIIGRW